jgi:hypothetical protein
MSLKITRRQLKVFQDKGLVKRDDTAPAGQTMNGWEADFADLLEVRRLSGEIRSWHWNRVSLRLTDVGTKQRRDRWHKPDFYVVDSEGIHIFYEVKGFERRDGITRLMSAASQFKDHRFVLVKRVKGVWEEEEIGANS